MIIKTYVFFYGIRARETCRQENKVSWNIGLLLFQWVWCCSQAAKPAPKHCCSQTREPLTMVNRKCYIRKSTWKKKSITGSIYMKHQKYDKSVEDKDVETSRIFLPGPRRWATSHFQKVFTWFCLKLMWHISLCRRLHPGKQRGNNQRRANVHTKRHIKAPATKTTSEFLRRCDRLWVHLVFQPIHTTGTCEAK